MSWKLISYSEIKLPLPPYKSEYIIGIVENGKGERKIVQIDNKYKETIFIGLEGNVETAMSPNGSIYTFIPKISREVIDFKIKTIGVMGTGVMGKGITILLLKSGFNVILKSRSYNALKVAMTEIDAKLSKAFIPEEKRNIMSRFKPTNNFSDLKDADLIIECIIEDEKEKVRVFQELERACTNDVILSTNTSSLSIDKLAATLSKPDRFIGIHFFNPVEKMQLVEIVRSRHTSEKTLEIALSFIRKIGKIPIIIYDSPGFIVNRSLFIFLNESLKLLEGNIASVEDIDLAIKLGLNHPMGPFELMDLIGLDVCLSIMENLYRRTNDPHFKPSEILRQMVKNGNLGRKTGKGFYSY